MSIPKLALAVLATGLLVPATAAQATTTSGDDVYLAAGLRGANEVGVKGDADGRSTVVIKISGNQVTFAIRWNKLDPPTAGHIHLGAKGSNGDVKLEFFTKPLPKTVLGVTGTVTATPDLVKALTDDPGGFYANLHDAAHPKGALRGQFHRLSKPVDLNGVLHGSNQATINSHDDGGQEVQANDGKKRGDKDGKATWWLRPLGSSIAYTAFWDGLSPVTNGHLHKGVAGVNGPVAVDLFGALPANVTGVAGEAPAPKQLVRRIAKNPGNWYTNLHTTEFDGGAVRGQLSGKPFTHPTAVTAEVLRGAQIYACTNGAFAQFGVSAKLRRGIDHSFVRPVAGPPQWIAPDGSAVRGKLVTKTPNGDGNIPELVLDAAQSGKSAGLLSHATQVLRLNTVGGVAPTGSCKDGAKAAVPYRADYLFLS